MLCSCLQGADRKVCPGHSCAAYIFLFTVFWIPESHNLHLGIFGLPSGHLAGSKTWTEAGTVCLRHRHSIDRLNVLRGFDGQKRLLDHVSYQCSGSIRAMHREEKKFANRLVADVRLNSRRVDHCGTDTSRNPGPWSRLKCKRKRKASYRS